MASVGKKRTAGKKRVACKKRVKRRQRGGNIFAMMNKINEYAKPFQQLAPRLLATGFQMANDIEGGKNWKESALDRIPETLKQVVAGKPFQLGSGIRRRRTRKQKKKKKKKNGIYS